MHNFIKTALLFTALTQALPQGLSQEPVKSCPNCQASFNAQAARKKTLILGKDFTLNGLIDHNGKPVQDADFKGKRLILQFGFADCTLICPKAMEALTQALSRYPKDEIRLLFIASKTGYTPANQQAFLQRFTDVGALGLTSSDAILQTLWNGKLHVVAPDGTHTPFSYFINEEGALLSLEPLLTNRNGQLYPAPGNIAAAVEKHFGLLPIKNRAPLPEPGF